MLRKPITYLVSFVVLAGLLLVVPNCHPLQPAATKSGAVVISVRLLNGKNGKPIKDDFPNIWLGDSKSEINPKTDRHGEIQVLVAEAKPRTIQFLPNYYFDCRNKQDTVAGRDIQYSLDKIISEGIVGENLCGKQHAEPLPGVLVVYVRPRTFMEKFLL